MSKIVSGMPDPHPTRYPWDEWFDGQTRLLEPDVDYQTSPDSFRSVVYITAKKAGMQAHVRIRPEGVYLRATPRDKEPQP
jgi:hypothetical protein